MDKFTLNKLAVDHPEVRPMQVYRQIYKQYSTYVRPLRNVRYVGVDKKSARNCSTYAQTG
jgi:DNA polymerase I-like protein with 3'-5' exonuclease and polymerase domains